MQIRAGNTAIYVFLLAVSAVFLALAALYESWSLPLAVILVVPMCLLCSVAGVLYSGRDVNIFVQIGLVVLVGLACKNAILIVEYAKQKHSRACRGIEATLEACRLRLRPILMTSFAFIIGVIPLVVASGAGSEMRRSLGIAVFSGMVGVTLFGIFLTPVFFSVILGLSEKSLFASAAARWVGSDLISGLAGSGMGFVFARLARAEVGRMYWAIGLGGTAGVLAALVALGLHERIRTTVVALAPGTFSTSSPETRCPKRRAQVVISRFFIDRPVFAVVLSVVIVLAGFVAVFTLPVAQYPEVTPPTVQVTAIYPGANALTVRNTVAAPIEEQVSGVENMLYMSSQCTNDGAYNLTVTFRLGMDTDMAQVLVQNRVSLALPVIPALVQNEGISVKKMSPNTLMIVNLLSPDNRYDSTFLSNYATIYIKDELGRLPGVAGITYLGQRDYSLRAWLDPAKLAALNLSATDVVTAISQQNLQVAAGQIGQQPVPQRPAISAHDQHAGPACRTGAVRRHHLEGRRPDQTGDGLGGGRLEPGPGRPDERNLSGRPDRSKEGPTARAGPCRRPPASSACAMWPASSWARGSTTSPAPSTAAVGGGLDLPVARLECARDRRRGLRQDEGAEEPVSRTGSITRSSTTRRRLSASRSTRSSIPCATR